MKTKLWFSVIILGGIIVFLRCSSPSDPKNTPPTISQINAIPDTVEPADTSSLSCTANDPDNDQLTYTWEATEGTINGSGSNISWIAPNTIGSYSISCKVEDGNGGQDIESTNVLVMSTNNPPNITSLSVDPDTILVNEISTLTCIANDPDNDILIYNWQATAGTINGSGAIVTWNAPDSSGSYTIKCSVNDGKSGVDSSAINIEVEEYVIPTDGLVAYYPFNGNANDESGNGNDGVVLGGATVNDVLVLRNNNFDRVSLPHTILDGLSDFACSAKLKINILHTTGSGIPQNTWMHGWRTSEDNAFSLLYYTNVNGVVSEWAFAVNNNYATGWLPNSDIEDHDWHHVVIQRSGSIGKLYIDGLQIGDSVTVAGAAINIDSNCLVLGQEIDDNGTFAQNQSWAGEMDNVRIYNRALSDSEIQALFYESFPNSQ